MQRSALLATFQLAIATPLTVAAPPLNITGPEQASIDMTRPDGGLPPVPGVANIQVFRASRDAAKLTDGLGWTYHHHVDMACWKGRLYVAWDSCEKDEDVWPSRELYATSDDGFHWSSPVEFFPQGVSTHLRMFFFHSPNGRMLAIAGLRTSHDPLNERMKGPLVVREIHADHSLGPVYLLRPPTDPKTLTLPPKFGSAPDKGFIEACMQLLANKPFLEQSDYGMLLGDRRMRWHDVDTWPVDEPSRQYFANRFGKAMGFYHRKDGALVAVMKFGWVMVSLDEGETWSPPTRPVSLVAGMAKVWGQRTGDNAYALVYNPDLDKRFPLVMVSGDDGINFAGMRVVHGELPPIRYPGLYKSPGPQYVRGVSEWSGDGSWPGKAMWVAYSMSKEDIWVSHVPVAPEQSNGWNIYSPKWAPVSVEDGELRLEDRDPADFARGQRLLNGEKKVDLTFSVLREQDGGKLHIDLDGSRGQHALRLTPSLPPGRWCEIRMEVDLEKKFCSAWIDGKLTLSSIPPPEIRSIEAISFTTGDRPDVIKLDQDQPTEPVVYRVKYKK